MRLDFVFILFEIFYFGIVWVRMGCVSVWRLANRAPLQNMRFLARDSIMLKSTGLSAKMFPNDAGGCKGLSEGCPEGCPGVVRRFLASLGQ